MKYLYYFLNIENPCWEICLSYIPQSPALRFSDWCVEWSSFSASLRTMRRASNLLEAALHRDLFTLEPWSDRNLLKINKNTCNILHPGWNNPREAVKTGWELPRRQFCRKKSRIQVKNKWKMSQRCAFAVREVQSIPDCII